MARISQDIIDTIRDTADILDIITDYVELKRRGRNFFGLCPFHTEKTPSFSVAPDKQIFHCFGCGIGGNVITFLMEYEKISFVEALQKLAQRYGIDLKFQQDETSREFFSNLYNIHNLAVEVYQKNLISPSGDRVRQYLERRGLFSETLERFSIGLSGKEWNHLYSLVKSKKFPDDVIDQCGLFIKSEKGTFDRFRDRLIFPITNLAGRVVAFAGRDLDSESDASQPALLKREQAGPLPTPTKSGESRRAKYLNSSETPIYHKSEILYGLSETKDAIRKERSVIIVEGYTDFLQLYQNNIRHAVATSGTALTERHVHQLRKFTDTTYLAYDGDAPGRKAAIAAGYNLLRGGLIPEIIDIPEDSDPDKWVKEKGPQPFQSAVAKAMGLIQFHLANTDFDLSKPNHRSRLAGEISDEIAGIRDEIIRQHTIKELAEKLAVDENTLVRLVASRTRKRTRRGKEKPVEESSSLSSSLERAQMEIVKLLAGGEPATISLLKTHINLDRFSHPVMKSIAAYLLPKVEEEGLVDLSGAVDQFQKKSERDLASRILFEVSPHTDSFQVAVDCLITLEQSPIKQSITEKRIRLRELERNGKDSSTTLQEIIQLQKQLKELEHKRTEWLSLV